MDNDLSPEVWAAAEAVVDAQIAHAELVGCSPPNAGTRDLWILEEAYIMVEWDKRG